MTEEQKRRYNRRFSEVLAANNQNELAVGFIRYEALRKLSVRQYTELLLRNLHGENFDGMVDELVAKGTEA